MSSSLPPIIGMTGFAQSGKDTAGQYLHKMYGYQRVNQISVSVYGCIDNTVIPVNPVI